MYLIPKIGKFLYDQPVDTGADAGAGKAGLGPRPAAVTTALSSSRAAVLGQLAEADGRPLRAQQIADALGQHVNTTREHLEGLVADGLATSTTDIPKGRGRPATLYSTGDSGSTWTVGRQYAALVDVLADHIAATEEDPGSYAFEAGQRWGERLLVEDRGADSGLEAVQRQFEEAGFEPERVAEGQWRLRRCPLLTGARKHPDIVCNVHAGLIATLLAGQGRPSEVEVEPFSTPEACIVTTRPLRHR